ncbi:uncharacterized protein LOC143822945 [Paroedura picta]|uniref:uncharacterized protein LOC143822945 n=1 Tax=Paroedura picta TaxID=143630 RepID=UPI0040578E14
MEETYLFNVEGVKKKILHGGYGELPDFKEGSKITFHFQTLKDDFERTVIDDSRESGVPMEIIVGKMFKIEVWETLLTSMRIGEVAEFWCDPIHTGMYALVSKSIRKIVEGKDPLEGQKHRCGMGNLFDYHSTGYTDLDELMRTPQPLIFIMELFKVEDPSAYKRDTWAMNTEEKLVAVPKLHTEGNRLVLSRKFKEASEKYQEAVICLRNIQAKEKPREEEWLHLEELMTPLVLNYCQCQLEMGEYYEVLEHTTDLLQKDDENVKAYFKRAKAHAAVWNEKEARRDFMRVTQLDPSLAAAVRKELKLLGEKMRRKHVEERKRYQGIFDYPPAKGGTEGQAGERKGLSGGQEEVPHSRLKAQVEENGPEALEESRPGALKPNRGAEWPGVVEKDGETERENGDNEDPGGLIRKEREMDNEDSTPQKEQEKMVTETGDEEQESQAQQKAHSYSEEERACCEISMPNQNLGFDEWKPKEEQEKVEEETMTLEVPEQNGALRFIIVKEEQGKLIQEDSQEEVEGAVGHLLATTEDMLNQECCETERSFLGLEREEDEARSGNGETQARDYSRPQEETGCIENFREWAREESSEEIFEEESERGEKVTTELSPREESSPEWWDCAGLREETSTAEKEESRAEMEWKGKEIETNYYSGSVQEIHEYENSFQTEYHEAETNPKETVMRTENCKEGIQDESPKIEIDLGEEFSWGRREEETARSMQEKSTVEYSSRVLGERWEDGVGLECLEDEVCFRIEKFKVGMSEENSGRDQDKENFYWEWPENAGGITHLSIKEESLSPWSIGDTPKDGGGDSHITRSQDTSQACCAMQMTEPGVKSVPNVWATKQPSPVDKEAQGNRE